MTKTPMGIAAKDLVASDDETLLGARYALTVIKPGYKPPRKAIVPRRAAIAGSNRLFLAGSAFADPNHVAVFWPFWAIWKKRQTFLHSLGAVCRPPYSFRGRAKQAFGAVCIMKFTTLTDRVGCESEHVIAGIRPSPMSS
jgi:hypothetical protein